MSIKKLIKREIHVAVHAQSAAFRIKKYLLFAVLFSITYLAFGLSETLVLLAVLTVLAVVVHIFFRFKTNAWTTSWGPYKRIPLPDTED